MTQARTNLFHLADGAALLALSNREALDLAAAWTADPPAGLQEAVPGAGTLLVLFDPDLFDPASLREVRPPKAPPPRRTVTLHAVYDGQDLPLLSKQSGVPVPRLIGMHASAEHTVAFLGFAPGYAYLSGAPQIFAVPRLTTPRVRVPAGSLAVANGYSGIYPAELPGGWRLIGRVAERMFDPSASPPALLRPGDRVVFQPVEPAEFRVEPSSSPSPRLGKPVLRVVSPGPFTSIQGGPRHGLAAFGVPAGGAMDVPLLARANARLGNAPLAAALECTLAGPEVEAQVAVRIAFQESVHRLRPGDRFKAGAVANGVRAYLAVEGGLAQPLPGELTRALRREDVLAREPIRDQLRTPPAPQSDRERRAGSGCVEIRALLGPQADSFRDAERFFAQEYQLSPQSDRRGLRLTGLPLDVMRGDIPSEGTAPGAVQVPGDGLPIVLGPDRPVTGGYPKIATVISTDLPVLGQLRPGARIRFRQVSLADALVARREELAR